MAAEAVERQSEQRGLGFFCVVWWLISACARLCMSVNDSLALDSPALLLLSPWQRRELAARLSLPRVLL